MKQAKEISDITIERLSDYIRFVEDNCSRSSALFRGQVENAPKKPNPLLPKIARDNPSPKKIVIQEIKAFEDFKRKALPFLDRNVPKNDWEWMTLAQHHGLPTRLLDWTRNPLAALWFAVSELPKNYQSFGLVWIFRPDERDYVDLSEDSSPFSIERTKVLEPSHIARRITAQFACFTVHKYITDKAKFIPLERNTAYKSKLFKIRIPGKVFASLKSQLDGCGINSATLFSDLDHLCEYIAWKEIS